MDRDNGFARALAYSDYEHLREWQDTESYDVWMRHCDKLLADAVASVIGGTRDTFDERKGVVTGIRLARNILEQAQMDVEAWKKQA